MCGKYFLSSGLLLILLTGLSFADLNQNKNEVIDLINKRQTEAASKALNQIMIEYSQDSFLPESLYWIAWSYGWNEKLEEEQNLYKQIIHNYPDSTIVSSARMCLVGSEIQSFIQAENFNESKQSYDKLITDFQNNSLLPEMLYRIARSYEWSKSNQFEQAKKTFNQVIQLSSDNKLKDKAKLGFARTEIQSLIVQERYDEAKQAFDKLNADFSSHPGLPDTLYWIVQRYGNENRYEEEKDLAQKIIEKYPDSKYAILAKYNYSKASIQVLIAANNFEDANSALHKFVFDFNSQPNLPNALYWIARRYEWANKYSEAANIFQLIVQNFPKNDMAKKAKLGISRMAIFTIIDSGREFETQEEINKLIVDFKEDPDLIDTLNSIRGKYEWLNKDELSRKIFELIQQTNPDSAKSFDIQRTEICERIFALMTKGDEKDIKIAVEQMKTLYANREELSSKLFWVAQLYEQHKFRSEALNIYYSVAIDFPEKSEGKDSVWYAIRNAYEIEDANGAELIVKNVIDRLNEQLAGTPQLSLALLRLGGTYYIQGLSREQNGIESAESFKKAIDIYEILIQQRPAPRILMQAKFYSGDCYIHLEQCEKALLYFNDVISEDFDNNYMQAIQLKKEQCK